MRIASAGRFAGHSLNSVSALTALALLSALSAATLTGCGIGKLNTSSTDVAQAIPAFKGTMMGGQTPVVNATIKIYATGTDTNCGTNGTGACTASDSGGYGVGTFLQEATQQGSSSGQDTDPTGTFSFPGGYRCPAGEFAYIVGSGGSPGNSSNPTNSKILLVAALGRCEDLYAAVTGDGTGYTSAPVVNFTGGGTPTTTATATANLGGSGGAQVTSVSVVNPGAGYSSVPAISFTGGGGSGAYAVATMSVNAVTVGAAGSNYTLSPVVSFSGGGGTGAAATASMGVNAINVVSGGSNYTQPPIITFSGGGGGSGASATAFLGSGPNAGQVVGYTINTAGSGYTSSPTVIITPASGDTTGSGASAAATLDVVSYTVTSAGSNYTSSPTVTLTNALADTTGSGATATSALQVASVAVPTGGYSGFTGPPLVINEITTVAAGYALGNFASVSGSTVGIGAPATNNAAKSGGISTGCVANGGSCTTTAAAGLYHAFQNALNLANPFNSTTVQGAPTSLPGNPSAVVPNALINSIADILANCVDTAGAGNQCNSSYLPSTTDTFSMVKALAANPTLGGSGTAATNLLTLASGAGAAFNPVVTTLNDFSIGINYPAAAAGSLVYDFSGALDINDVYYIGSSAVSGSGPIKVVSLSSNGSVLGISNTSALKNSYSMTMDALGNGYFGAGSGSGNSALGVFTTSGGVPTLSATPISIITSSSGSQGAGLLKVYAIATDLANNVWVTGDYSGANTTVFTYKCPPTVTTSTVCVGEPGGNHSVNSSGNGLAVDPNQNVWVGTNATLGVIENTGTVSAPAYATTISSNNTVTTTSLGGAPILGITFAGSPYVGYVSEYKTAGAAGIQPITPTLSGAGITAISASAVSNLNSSSSTDADTGPYTDEADGNGTVWAAGFNDHSIIEFLPGVSSSNKVNPCLGATTTCTSIFTGTTNKPTSVSIDSTGSVWSTNPGGSQVVQIIGSAAPTWPLLSLGKVGTP